MLGLLFQEKKTKKPNTSSHAIRFQEGDEVYQTASASNKHARTHTNTHIHTLLLSAAQGILEGKGEKGEMGGEGCYGACRGGQ
jgi:hypothetical protein